MPVGKAYFHVNYYYNKNVFLMRQWVGMVPLLEYYRLFFFF